MKWLLALAAAAPLWGQCTYSVSPTQFSIAAGSATGSVAGPNISVTAGSGCSWGATTNTSWLHIVFGQTGSGNGTVGWSADTNTFPTARTGTLSVAAQNVTVTQAAQTCSYAFSPQSANSPVTGGAASFQVQTTCSWSAASNNPSWIQIPGNTSATGNGTVGYNVSANGCVAGRSGSISLFSGPTPIAGAQFPIAQDGSAANFSFSPASESYAAAATDDRIAITTGTGCGWNAFSDVSWLQITGANSGAGNGALTLHVLANTSAARTGNLHMNNGVAVLLLPVAQAAPTPPPVQLAAVENAASYSTGAVSPGEIVSLFGTNLGPATGVGLQVAPNGQSIAKTLGGVQALFDNVPAALTYASAVQVNAVVPYGVSGNAQTVVQVVYQGAASNSLTIPVQPSTPAIFTLSATGQGGGAILNQDLSVNGPNNPAARGSIVAIYCTGGGVTDPPSVDASITGTPLPNLTLPVSVAIGGVAAPPVPYAGGAPGAVAGLTQINVMVPSGVTPGAAVPVMVTIGTVQSPAGVTLAVQ